MNPMTQRSSRDPTVADPVARAVQIGLMIYLSPVVLLVAAIGTASMAAQVASRLVHRAHAESETTPSPYNYDARAEEGPTEGGRRRLPVAH